MSRLTAVCSGVCLLATTALAQPDFSNFEPREEMEEHMERHDERPPMIILGPPEGFEPPEDMPEMDPENPEEAKRMAVKMFFRLMDHSGDGVLDFDEFTHWIRDFVVPGDMPDDMRDDGRRRDDERGHRDDEHRQDDERGHMDDDRDHMDDEHRKDNEGRRDDHDSMDDDDHMDDERRREGDRRHMEEEGRKDEEGRDEDDHMDDGERGHMEDDRGDGGNPMDQARRKMDEARKRMEQQTRGRMGGADDHPEDDGDGEHMEHEDDGDHDDGGNPMDQARSRMDDARRKMEEQVGDRMGDMRGRMEEEGREHMEEMMMDGFHKDMHPDLAKLPDAPHCSDDLRERELNPQREGASCGDGREGNLFFRTICNMPGFGAAAISLPRGRAASCFGIRALTGKIGFEIVSEDGRSVWNMSMGPESYEHLKLDAGVYHIKATGGDPDSAITISFVDVSTER